MLYELFNNFHLVSSTDKMPRKPYVQTHYVGLRLPIGFYEDIIELMNSERRWNSPQEWIKDAIQEKIERWKKEHSSGYGSPERVKKEE